MRLPFLLLSLLFSFPLLADTAGAFSVAVTIKPVHALVAGLMKGVGEPALIMGTSASPHHYTLRPSERRSLANASLIFWIGPELESFMPRILESLDPETTNIALIETEGLQRLPTRTDHHHADEHADIDPHIWLSAQNARTMIDVIADALSRHDPANAHRYKSNRVRMHQRISDTDQQIHHLLSGRTSAFVSYHDAYQYFEHAYQLNHAGFVSNSDELSPGARHIRELRELIRKQEVHCLFYDAPFRPALVDTLVRDLEVKMFELDAMGMRYNAGEDAWFEIMNGLARAYDACL